MVFLLYCAVSLLALVYFMKVQKKYLHPVEIFFYWCLASLLIQNREAILTMNLKTVVIPNSVTYEFSNVLTRLVFYPLVTLFGLNEVAAASSYRKKTWIIAKYSALLLSLEWISDELGVFQHLTPYSIGAGAYWVAVLLLLMAAMFFYRKRLYKGTQQP